MSANDAPKAPVLDALRAALGSAVLEPGMPEYLTEVLGFNLSVTHTPDVAVAARTTADIVAAVNIAAEFDTPISVQATGHGGDWPIDGGILVSTKRLAHVAVDPLTKTATVGPATRWDAVLSASAPYGLAGLCGSAPDVGVVGYTLGGGLSPLGRTFGFAADLVREIEVVTPDGLVRRVTAESEGVDGELFWALRGGKTGLGVVTEMTFDLLPISTVYGGALFFAAEDAANMMHYWAQWVKTVPESVCTSAAILRLPPLPEVPEFLQGKTVLHIRVAITRNGPVEEALLAQLRDAAPALLDSVGEIPMTAIGSIHADPADPVPFWGRGVLLKDCDSRLIDTVLGLAGPEHELPLLAVEIRQFGGALARPSKVPNAVGGRDAGFQLFVVGMVMPQMPPGLVPMAGNTVLAAVEPWSTGGTQINFHGAPTDPEKLAHAWPADIHERLQAVRQRVDPAGIFRPAPATSAQAVSAEPPAPSL
ncbi:FAD-binding oxidoreductase [Arthrobacter pigmenti]